AIRGEVAEVDAERVRTQLGRALGSMAPRIERITVRFEDMNGPRGGVDTICRIKAVVSGEPSVVVEERGHNHVHALGRAPPRIKRSLRQLFDRRRGKMPSASRAEKAPARRTPSRASSARGATARRNPQQPTRRMRVALEESSGKPSRKSTRRSLN